MIRLPWLTLCRLSEKRDHKAEHLNAVRNLSRLQDSCLKLWSESIIIIIVIIIFET